MHRLWSLLALPLLFATAPSSTNYTLKTYDIGTGAGNGSSTNYGASGQVGGNNGSLSSTNFGLPAGVKSATTVPVPTAPTFTNPSSYFDRLKLTLTVTGFPTDTKYLIAISNDSFATTNYVQLDNTVGTSNAVANYQTYAAWGGASGFLVLGLSAGTTYQVKVAALQGSGTGSKFGPTASAATVQPTLTFGLTTSLTSTPPFAVGFTSLPAGSVISGTATVTANLTTNAASGTILVIDQYGGLRSPSLSFTISSASADLTSASNGYGAQVTSTSQSSGGPLAATSPFNGTSNNVGVLSTTWQQLASFANPLTSGSLTFALLAKTDSTVPSASDYADTLTISLAPVF